MMHQEVLERAAALAGPLSQEQQARLELLCTAAVSVLEMQLRDGLTPEDCREENLIALCAGCHLRADAEHHAETRRKKHEGKHSNRHRETS